MEAIRASFEHNQSDTHKSRGPLCGRLCKTEQHSGAAAAETEIYHYSGVAHRILQVGFIVLKVDGTDVQWGVQSHLQRVDKITPL